MTNFGAVAGRIEPIKSANYSEVMMGVSGVFNQDQLHSAFTSVRVLVEQIQLISRKCLNVIGDDVVK